MKFNFFALKTSKIAIFGFFITIFSAFFAPLLAEVNVMVSVLPQKYIVQKIAKDKAKVEVMVPKNKSPEIYEPLPSQMKTLKDMNIYVGVGMPFEKKWLPRFRSVNPKLRFIDSTQVLQQAGIKLDDPHIWLSVRLMKLQAREIFNAIVGIDFKNRNFYKENFEELLSELDKLDEQIKNIFAQNGAKKAFVVYHAAFGHFAKDYGLTEIAIEEDGKEAKGAHLKNVMSVIKEQDLHTIFIQPQFSKRQVEAIRQELGMQTQELDPILEDWNQAMLDYANAIANQK